MTRLQGTVAVGKKSQRLRSRVEALEAIFKVPSDDKKEQARRDELLRYAVVFHHRTRA